MNLLLIGAITMLSIMILGLLIKRHIDKINAKAETSEARIISRKKATDRHGLIKYYATFEFINRDTLELEVPILIYELATTKITGKLTFESMRFIRFIKESGNQISNQFAKNY